MIIFLRIIDAHDYPIREGWPLSFNEARGYIREFYKYSQPLYIYGFVGMLVGIFDRWLLQISGGSVQQGFYSLSFGIGAVCTLFTSAMTPLFTREFSIAYYNKDLSQMKSLFRKHIPLLYSITALIACFVAVNADKITLIMGGGRFKEAAVPVAIMAFYPIHQTYGNLSGSVFYAAEKTKLYSKLGIIFMLIGLPVTFFLIAPEKYYGLHAGAFGLAIKMVLIQFLGVNVQLYFNTKYLELHFIKYFGHQLFTVACFLVLAIIASWGINEIALLHNKIILGVLVSGSLYAVLVTVIIYYFPVVLGLAKQDVMDTKKYIMSMLKQ